MPRLPPSPKGGQPQAGSSCSPSRSESTAGQLCAAALRDAARAHCSLNAQRRFVKERCKERISELEGELRSAAEREAAVQQDLQRLRRRMRKRGLKELGITHAATRDRDRRAVRCGAVDPRSLVSPDDLSQVTIPGQKPGRTYERTWAVARRERVILDLPWHSEAAAERQAFEANLQAERRNFRESQLKQRSFLDDQCNRTRQEAAEREGLKAAERASEDAAHRDWTLAQRRAAVQARERMRRAAADTAHFVDRQREERAAREAREREAHELMLQAAHRADWEERMRRREQQREEWAGYCAYREAAAHARQMKALARRAEQRQQAEHMKNQAALPESIVTLREQRRAKQERMDAVREAGSGLLRDAAARREQETAKALQEQRERMEWEQEDERRRREAVHERNRAHRNMLDEQRVIVEAQRRRQEEEQLLEKAEAQERRRMLAELEQAEKRKAERAKRRTFDTLALLAEASRAKARVGPLTKII
eukprot:TRINITY_DN70568_c0_g1_i1.p1 TRINITY_DN70568_c0_g1~~TRINITY_DN70568_c0_g1_i1.p1  ORF type:complete len:513 (+),score=215.87 TRINITY_DN70568_c0_g1_i1:89-1540(+)